ncbi:hypothetical protein [Bacillus andreraoultii]|nr:hypothetical protein [Bacillus andreraoultii]
MSEGCFQSILPMEDKLRPFSIDGREDAKLAVDVKDKACNII